ncbi:flavodoxin domain-containing protein [Streptomyces venezuelae]|uniref:flavodoxin domain-containing protein n=1 Tax=Streptomyces venezuelae TaxID=54571 RepID=UPI0037AA2FF9
MLVLVGYATTHGSTREIAERLGMRLGAAGLHVDVRPMREIHGPSAYGAFVLGSAVHRQAWLPEAQDFVRLNGDLLGNRPVWFFSVGMPGALRGPWKRMAYKEEPYITESLPGHVPFRRHWLLSGVIRPEHLSRAGRLLFRLMGCRFGDFRDWPGIDARADQIACELLSR